MDNLGKKPHTGRIENSGRLRETLNALSDGYWKSTAEIASITKSVAPHSDISDLRINLRKIGKNILCKYRGLIDGRKVFEYQLVTAEGGEC